MKLDDLLKRALETGHVRYVLTSTARGVEVARGEVLQTSAAELETLAREDAAPLSREGLHEYSLTLESDDGAKRTRVPIRVHGGKGAQDDHTVDVERTQSSGAVIGHLVRLIVEQQKAFMTTVNKVIERDMAETAELGKLRRAQGKRGEIELVKVELEREAEVRREDAASRALLWNRVFELGAPLLMKVLPGGPATALGKFRESLTPVQAERICNVLGPGRFARLMSLSDPGAVASMFCDEVDQATGAAVFAVLTDDQKAIVGAALQAEMKRRDAASKAAPAANGAAS